MQKFINGRSGQFTPEYQEAYDQLCDAFSTIANNRTPHFKRVPNIFNQDGGTLGIHDVTHLPAKKQRDLLQYILIVEKMQYDQYVDVCNCIAGGDTYSEALKLLLLYMGAKYYWRNPTGNVQTIEEYAQSWIGRYTCDLCICRNHTVDGVVIDYEVKPTQHYVCNLLVEDRKNGVTHWMYKRMSKVERARVRYMNSVADYCPE